MGRRKKATKQPKIGVLYFADRRLAAFTLFRDVLSRQNSANNTKENLRWFKIEPAPTVTTLMIIEQRNLFGRAYVKVLATNINDSFIGFISLKEFLHLIRCKPDIT